MLGSLFITDLIIFFLTIILVYLAAKKTPKNNYYLKWLIGSLLLQIFALLLWRFSVAKVVPIEYTNLVMILRGLSLVLLTIHIQSLINGREEKLTKTDKIAFGVFVFLLLIISLGGSFFKEPFIGLAPFNLEVKADYPTKDLAILWVSYLLFLFIRVYKKCLKNVLNSNQLKRPLVYLFWINGYFLFVALNSWISFLTVFEVNLAFVENVDLKNIFGIISITFIIFNPTILFHFQGRNQFSIVNPLIKFELKDTFIDIVDNQKMYLKPRVSLNDFSVLCESNPSEIRNYILMETGLSFNDYVNGYRVSHSVALMNQGYLKSHSIYALGEECGFNSNQSFFRAFRKVHNTSPAKYYKLQIYET